MTAQFYIYFALFIIIQHLPLCYSVGFTTGSKMLPRSTSAISIAYDAQNDSILLIGGRPHMQQLVLFKNNDFVFDSEFYLSSDQQTYALGQGYTVHRNHLWSTRYMGHYYVKVNLQTYQVEVPSVTLPVPLLPGNCVTSIDGYLFHFDGLNADPAASFLIYRFSDGQWLFNVSSLAQPRGAAACVVVDYKIYIIGGKRKVDSQRTDTIEVLDVSNIDAGLSTSWHYFGDTLTGAPRNKLRATVHGTHIYAVGGASNDANAVTDVTIIDTVTGQCIAGDSLSYPVASAACVVVWNILYVFGGDDVTGNAEDRYQYLTVPPLSANDPTMSPTEDPSTSPTDNPNVSPTIATIISATNDLTAYPTSMPSIGAITRIPTRMPSIDTTASALPSQTSNNMMSTSSMITSSRVEVQNHVSPPDTSQGVFLVTVIAISGSLVVLCLFVIFCVFRRYFDHDNMEIDLKKDIKMKNPDNMTNGVGLTPPNQLNVHDESDSEHIDDDFIGDTGGDTQGCMETCHNVVPVNVLNAYSRDGETTSAQKREVIKWMAHVVHLPQYTSTLLTHGFESMRVIKSIGNVSVLLEVGIANEAHLALLMAEINKFKMGTMSTGDPMLAMAAITEEAEKSDEDDIEKLYDHEGIQRVEGNTCTKETPLTSGTAQSVPQRTNDIEFTAMDLMRNVDEANVDQEGLRNSVIVPN